jgi:hypothetical protein
MIPYADLERALSRWKARSRAGGPGVGDSEGGVNHPSGDESIAKESNGVPRASDLSGEIDINELVESYED